MVFIIPILLGAAAGVTGVIGIATGAEGWSKIEEAQKKIEEAKQRYAAKANRYNSVKDSTESRLRAYDEQRHTVFNLIVLRFRHLCKQLKQKLSVSELEFLQRLTLSEVKSHLDGGAAQDKLFENLGFTGATIVAMGGTAAVVQMAVFELASLVGTASTGTAIGALSGAAATNATLAWLGGGSLAAGGGGMALGSLVLNAAMAGPALMIGGIMLAGKGEKDLTEATEFAAEVDKEIAKIDAYIKYLETGVQPRIAELQGCLEELSPRCHIALNDLERAIHNGFEVERDAETFQRVFLLVKALYEIIDTDPCTGNRLSGK
ncbi:hypothetical protein [Thermosynechococcus vestitus]|uniref:Tll1781 protein n=1 Tax=Thermosynechococcus vestitus (strain NIES-2133 / IAM M-273 / BP-1) TaxID=197221 RepID=Q8DI11_THEVB|nr:hypothetical protein [Thermosynechococcus vestitus]BAC09333.1 tll1781 [Thermosynechococcus vestitus BP-1]